MSRNVWWNLLELSCRKGLIVETSKYRHTKFPTSGIFSKRCIDLQIEMSLAIISVRTSYYYRHFVSAINTSGEEFFARET